MKKSFWPIFSLILLLIIVYLSTCRKSIPPSDLVAKSDSLVNKVKADSVQHRADSIALVITRATWADQRTKLTDSLNRSETRLYNSVGTINRLAEKLAAARLKTFDSTFIAVAPAYKEACDSLEIVARQQSEQIKENDIAGNALIDQFNYEIFGRDSVIEERDKNITTLRADFNAQTHFFQLAVKQGKPRTKAFAGISALGNTVHPFGGGEVSLTVLTKKDQIWEIASGFLLDEWYGRVGTKFKIKF